MGLILVPAFFGYTFLVFVIGIPAILGAGFERAGIPPEEAPKGPRRIASIGAFAVTLLLHVGIQVVPQVVAGSYYGFTLAISAWFGVPSLLAFVIASACLALGRRRKNPVLLAVSQGIWVAMFVFIVIAIPELMLLDALGVRAEH
jgi:hypothetical protein